MRGDGWPILLFPPRPSWHERSVVPDRRGGHRLGGVPCHPLRDLDHRVRPRAGRQADPHQARADPRRRPQRSGVAGDHVAVGERLRPAAALGRDRGRAALVLREPPRGADRSAADDRALGRPDRPAGSRRGGTRPEPLRRPQRRDRGAADLHRGVPEHPVLLRHPGLGARRGVRRHRHPPDQRQPGERPADPLRRLARDRRVRGAGGGHVHRLSVDPADPAPRRAERHPLLRPAPVGPRQGPRSGAGPRGGRGAT